MSDVIYEVYRNGEPTHRLFLSKENAQHWIDRQVDGEEYTIMPYAPW